MEKPIPSNSSALNLADQIINDPSASFWLQKSITSALSRDLVDAVNDAELLLSILTARLEEVSNS